MKLLKTIKDKEVVPDYNQEAKPKYSLRKAARAVVFGDDKKIALLNVSKNNYHKLPGGGIELNESIQDTLKREILEETGCDILVENEIGKIIEFRDRYKIKQESYCYVAKTIGCKRKPSFTQKELDQGFKLEWHDLDNAINLLTKDKPKNYEGKFIQLRDLTYLKVVREKF